MVSQTVENLRENLEYMDSGSAIAAERLVVRGISDDEASLIAQACLLMSGRNDVCAGVDCTLSIVSDSLQEFVAGRNGSWNERGTQVQSQDPRIFAIRALQVSKGMTRDDLAVIDFGDVRVALRWVGGQ